MSLTLSVLRDRARFSSSFNVLAKHRFEHSVVTNFTGINGEKIIYEYTDLIDKLILEIYRSCSSKGEGGKAEAYFNEALYSASIEGADTDRDKVMKCIETGDGGKSEKMVANIFNIAKDYREVFSFNNAECLPSHDSLHKAWELVVKDVCENTNVKGTMYRDVMCI